MIPIVPSVGITDVSTSMVAIVVTPYSARQYVTKYPCYMPRQVIMFDLALAKVREIKEWMTHTYQQLRKSSLRLNPTKLKQGVKGDCPDRTLREKRSRLTWQRPDSNDGLVGKQPLLLTQGDR
jgi:hypothetical protein